MAKLKSLDFWYGLLLMVLTISFVGCVDDNDDTEAPFLEVSPLTLNFTGEGTPAGDSQNVFHISTNRPWTATVRDAKDWVTLSQISGEGSADVTVSVPAGVADEAKVDVEISNNSGVLMRQTVTIVRGQQVEAALIYKETFGDANVEDKPFPDQYEGWNTTGDGAANVTYTGNNVSIRSTGLANTDAYDGASGPNVAFFGKNPSALVVNKIALKAEQTSLRLTFGASRSSRSEETGDYDNTFKTETFVVELSADGNAWTPLAYEVNNGDQDYPYWVFATADFTLAKAVSELYIRFTANEGSVYRLDDITLETGNGGQEISLDGGTVDPEPGDAVAITIPELIAMMSDGGTVIDNESDRYFEAVVQADVAAGNWTNNQLQVAVEGATEAGQGLTLYGSQVNPSDLGLEKGDKVRVTLYKGLARAELYNGLYEVTGDKDVNWVKVEKIGTASITPVVITPDRLIDYQAMTVTVENASSNTAGECAATHTFTANGQDFTVYCKGGSVFDGKNYEVATGNVTGIVTLHRGTPQVAPRNLDDVAAFISGEVDPEPDPEPGEGGEYTSISPFLFENGENVGSAYGQEAVIDGETYSVLKLGTGSKSGAFTSGALGVTGDKKLSFYAVAWKGKKATLYLRVNNGGEAKTSGIELNANDGATGNPTYTLTLSASDYYTVDLTGLTESSTVTVSTSENFDSAESNAPRAILCGFQLQ